MVELFCVQWRYGDGTVSFLGFGQVTCLICTIPGIDQQYL